MNVESELLAPEVIAPEEPRYLRRQKPLEVRRRKFGRRTWSLYRRWILVGAGILAGSVLCFEGVRFCLYSPLLQLSSDGQIEVTGNHYVTRDQVTAQFSSDLGKSILLVPLDERRTALEKIPWVEQATVERLLPNRVRVDLIERTPVAFLRSGYRLQLVDGQGVILDRPLRGDFVFPVVTGIGVSMAPADRAERMALFGKFMQDIALAKADADSRVSEVDLSDPQDVRATLAGLSSMQGQGPVVVHFGDSDFVNKYRMLVDDFGQWKASAGTVQSVDLRFSGQVVVNPEIDAARSASFSEHKAGAR